MLSLCAIFVGCLSSECLAYPKAILTIFHPISKVFSVNNFLQDFFVTCSIQRGCSGSWLSAWYSVSSDLQWRPSFAASCCYLLSASCAWYVSLEMGAMSFVKFKSFKIFRAPLLLLSSLKVRSSVPSNVLRIT